MSLKPLTQKRYDRVLKGIGKRLDALIDEFKATFGESDEAPEGSIRYCLESTAMYLEEAAALSLPGEAPEATLVPVLVIHLKVGDKVDMEKSDLPFEYEEPVKEFEYGVVSDVISLPGNDMHVVFENMTSVEIGRSCTLMVASPRP